MTLNEFYSVKLENVHKFISFIKLPQEESPELLEKIERIVKDNEVRIPYDEDIFIGIDKNYKTLKRILVTLKEVYSAKFETLTKNDEMLSSLNAKIECMNKEMKDQKKTYYDEVQMLQTDIEILKS